MIDPRTSPASISMAALEEHLLRQRTPALNDLQLPCEFVLPDYSLSIGNVPATLAALLQGDLAGALPPLPDVLWRYLTTHVRRVICVILDAVGWYGFLQALEAESQSVFARLARQGRLAPLTSVFPSTTTSALTTLWTGYAPAQHGLVGHNMHLPEFDEIVDTLGFCPAGEPRQGQMVKRGLIPERFALAKGLAEALAEQGIVTRTLIRYDMVRSPLSRLCFRGVREIKGIVTAADMWVSARETLRRHLSERLLLVIYWGELDAISHLRGPGSDAWRAELRSLGFSLERELLSSLAAVERAGTVLVITADHGQIMADASSSVLLADHPRLHNGLIQLPSGGPRSAYLFVRPGQAGQVMEYVSEHLGDRFHIDDSSALLDAGLLGPGQPTGEARHRVGDLTMLARGTSMLDNQPREEPLLGMHGGLSPEEMLVPLLISGLE